MNKYIIREVQPTCTNFDFYFEDDAFNERSGDYNNTLFVLSWCRGKYSGVNKEAFYEIQEEAEQVIEDCYDGECKNDHSPELQVWAESAEVDNLNDIAKYLTIKTGKQWEVLGVHGYSQGDYAEILYCTENYSKKTVVIFGEVFLGCAKEFEVIEVDENGDEIEAVYGFIVSDSEAGYEDEEYKRIVSEWAGIDETDTVLEMFDGYTIVEQYRTA